MPWLIGGESGVGKSRLVDELRTLALVNGALVIRDQAVREGSASYQLSPRILRWLALQKPLTEFEASVLKGIVPDIDELVDFDVPDAPQLDPEATLNRLYSVIEDILLHIQHPVVLIIEDIHWASSAMIHILERLSQLVGGLQVLLVSNYRNDERPELPDLLPDMQQLNLNRLPREEIALLGAAMLGDKVGSRKAVVDLLQRETEGNIFFIVEVVRALAENVGEFSQIGQRTLPAQVFAQGIVTVLQRRLQQIPEDFYPLLKAAAIAGRHLDPVLLQLIEPDLDLDHWLVVCSNASVIDVEDNRWRFAHDKLRETLLAELPPSEKQQLHEQVALAIEGTYPDSPAYTASLAHHWREAGKPAKETTYTALTGEGLLSNGVYHEAIPFLQRALDLADEVGMEHQRRAQLERQLGEAYYGAGQMNEARTHLTTALRSLGHPSPTSNQQLVWNILKQGLRQSWHRIRLDGFKKEYRAGNSYQDWILVAQTCERIAQIYYFNNDTVPISLLRAQGNKSGRKGRT